jgi:aquaporin Z
LRFVFPERALIGSRLGTPHLGAHLMQLLGEGAVVTWRGIFTGVAVEAFATFVLTVVIFFTILDRRAARAGGLYAGLAQAALTIFGYSLTGCAANPARWFGPAVWQLSVQRLKDAAPFADNIVYWTGPIVGALLGGLLYTTILSPAGKPREAGS